MKNNFSFLEKFIFKFIFRFEFLNRVLFDIEKVFIKKKTIINDQVFITGLPRSGTTILLNVINSSQEFACSTYRNMPFVLSPNIWSYFSRLFKKSISKERAHKDGIKIDIDSPEAFEEVFWKIFSKKKYIKDKKLIEHTLDNEILSEFQTYTELLCQSKKKTKYLSKNNNNILRITDLSEYLNNGKIVIMFRDPLNHCTSLRKQYFNFLNLHEEDKFFLNYMNFLSHHEFGLSYKSLFIDDLDDNKNDLNFWLKKWCYVYSKLIKKNNSKNILFLSYESFCENPKLSLKKIVNNEGIISKMNFENLKNNNNYINHDGEAKIEAYNIYTKMINLTK